MTDGYVDEEDFADVEVMPNAEDKVLGPVDPLDVLEDLMTTAESEQVRANAAGKLAEYRHMKMQPDTVDAKRVNINIEMQAPAKPMTLPTKKS